MKWIERGLLRVYYVLRIIYYNFSFWLFIFKVDVTQDNDKHLIRIIILADLQILLVLLFYTHLISFIGVQPRNFAWIVKRFCKKQHITSNETFACLFFVFVCLFCFCFCSYKVFPKPHWFYNMFNWHANVHTSIWRYHCLGEGEFLKIWNWYWYPSDTVYHRFLSIFKLSYRSLESTLMKIICCSCCKHNNYKQHHGVKREHNFFCFIHTHTK